MVKNRIALPLTAFAAMVLVASTALADHVITRSSGRVLAGASDDDGRNVRIIGHTNKRTRTQGSATLSPFRPFGYNAAHHGPPTATTGAAPVAAHHATPVHATWPGYTRVTYGPHVVVPAPGLVGAVALPLDCSCGYGSCSLHGAGATYYTPRSHGRPYSPGHHYSPAVPHDHAHHHHYHHRPAVRLKYQSRQTTVVLRSDGSFFLSASTR